LYQQIKNLFNQQLKSQNNMKTLKERINACMVCVTMCESCITDCIMEGNQQCIMLCRDCADICLLYAKLEARGSRYAQQMQSMCVEICEMCAEECMKFSSKHASCKECAEACQNCAEVCEELVRK
jgi:hypothetical protein